MPSGTRRQVSNHSDLIQEKTQLEGLQHQVFKDRYALKGEDGTPLEEYPEQMWARVAQGIAAVEPTKKKKTEWAEKFYHLLQDFKFVPGGRILSGAGTPHEVTYYNCYVVGLGEDPLDAEAPKKPMLNPDTARSAFFSALSQMTDIMSRSGGVGINLSALPPAGTPITVAGRGRSGAVRPTVALSVAHPDIESLLAEKNSPNLAHVDIAVILPPEFDQAIKDDLEWTPQWGDRKGETIRARDLWSRVTSSEGRHVAVIRPDMVTITVDDSRDAIVDGAAQVAMDLFQGTAPVVDFSSLRPKGAYIRTVNGTSSGPVAWMYLFDAVARSDDGASPEEKGIIWFGEIASVVTGKTIQQGGCFGPDQRIATNRGLLRAAELADRLDAGEQIDALTHEGPRKITCTFRNGLKPLFHVRTARGFTVEVTGEHKMGVLRGGRLATVPLAELEPGDEVLLCLGEAITGDYVRLESPAYERSVMSTRLNDDVRLPEVLDERLAYFLGNLYGDGYVHWGHKVTWHAPKAIKLATADAHPAIRAQLVEYARQLFNLEPTIEQRKDDACANVALYSRVLIDWLQHNGLLKARAEEVRVPEAIFRSPSSVMGAFVAGYFDADGCDRERKGGYGFDSVSLGMLSDIQQLLVVNGILSHLNLTDRSAQGWRTIYRLVVTGAEFKERMNQFIAMALKNRSTEGYRNHHNGYAREVWPELGVGGRYYQGVWDSTKPRISYHALTRVQERLTSSGQVALAERVEQLLRTVPDRIVAIEPLEASEVFDFEVAETHMLSGNGIYTSNSRRGALMLMLDDDHPDVEAFIAAKRIDPVTGRPVMIEHANMSLCISDAFMAAVQSDLPWDLKWQGKVVRTVRARDIWDQICDAAWRTAEPGVVFMQRAQEQSPMWYVENIRCTNPCGEQPIPAGAVCNLGAINLAQYVDNDGNFLEADLARDAAYATRFLDDVIDATPYFSELHVKMQREGTRRVGLGTMGLADALIKMNVAYGSAESLEVIDRIYRTIRDAAYQESVALAEEKGACGFFDKEKYLQGPFIQTLSENVRDGIREHGIRNGVVLTQAPTGTTSLLAGVSSGIEPVYAFAMKRVDRIGEHIIYHPLYQAWLSEHDGEDRPAYFVEAKDLSPEQHVVVQGRVQQYTDASISKTVNGPNDNTIDDVKRLYLLAYDLGCKGVTYYRDGSRDAVLSLLAPSGESDSEKDSPVKTSTEVTSSQAGGDVSLAVDSYQETHGSKPSTLEEWILKGQLKRRPSEMAGFTLNIAAPEGKVNITINSDDNGPLEVFVNIGRAGSDVAALAEALGRLISLQLRLPSTMSQEERLRQAANQLRGIGGSRSIGFGKQRVSSLPDAVAQAIYRHLEEHPLSSHPPLKVADVEDLVYQTAAGESPNGNGYAKLDGPPLIYSAVATVTGNLCPQCGSVGSYVMEEGCRKCHNCGYSEC